MRATRPVLRVGPRDLVVVAGLPGSGKTTLLRSLRVSGSARVLDPEQVAGGLARVAAGLPYRTYRPLVHTVHWARVAAFGLLTPGPVLVHATGTRQWQRLLLRLLAAVARRPQRYVWLDVEASVAYASTYLRGRPHRWEEFAGHVRRAARGLPERRTVVDRDWVNAQPRLVVGAPAD